MDYWKAGFMVLVPCIGDVPVCQRGRCGTHEFMQEAGTGKLRLAVNIRSTAAADAHTTRPPVGECSVDVILDVVQRVKDNHISSIGDLVLLDVWLSLNLGSIPEDLQGGHFY